MDQIKFSYRILLIVICIHGSNNKYTRAHDIYMQYVIYGIYIVNYYYFN